MTIEMFPVDLYIRDYIQTFICKVFVVIIIMMMGNISPTIFNYKKNQPIQVPMLGDLLN
jgi:hypothetical protein